MPLLDLTGEQIIAIVQLLEVEINDISSNEETETEELEMAMKYSEIIKSIGKQVEDMLGKGEDDEEENL